MEYITKQPIISFFTDDRNLIQEIPHLQVKNITTLQSRTSGSQCRYCSKLFSQVGFLNRHESHNCPLNPLTAGNKKLKSFVCDTCGSSYKHKKNLLDHKRNDCGRSHQCSFCGYIFSELRNLKRHLRSESCPLIEKHKTL